VDVKIDKMIIQELINSLPQTGRIEWIGLRPSSSEPMNAVAEAEIIMGKGLVGDRYSGTSGKREVTLIQAEHLVAVGAILGGGPVSPAMTRRNIMVSGINLLALQDRRFRLGEVVLEMTGFAYPCSKMEANLGAGGYNAMRGHGGITARVIVAGRIRVGDVVELIKE
jgi:MOSC domain-containing protein YiiM